MRKCVTHKVKCGMKNAESLCVTVGKMRNAEFCAVCRRESAAVPMSIGQRRPKCTCLRGGNHLE